MPILVTVLFFVFLQHSAAHQIFQESIVINTQLTDRRFK